MLRHTAVALALLGSLATGLCAQERPCNCPDREYTATPTDAVRRLFAAASRADTTAFFIALAAVPAADSFAIDETPLISTILWAQRWPAELSQDRFRTYNTVLRTSLDSLRAAHRASWPARERMLSAALARKVDPNGFTQNGIPPLLLAAVMGSPRMVEQLLMAGANPNVQMATFDNINAIEFALDHEFRFRILAFPEFTTVAERTAIIRRLLRAGTKAPWAGERFRMPAHSPWALIAALTEGDSVAREMIAAGLSATQTDVDGIPPITAAAQFGNAAVVRLLRDVGPRSARVVADSIVWGNAAPADTGATDLWLDAANAAASDTSGRVAELLLQRGMRWTQPGPLGVVHNVPAHHQGVYGRQSLERDSSDRTVASAAAATVSTSSPLGRSGGNTPIVHAAAEANNVSMLRQLRALGAPLNDTVQYRGSPLSESVRAAAYDAARWLLVNGADPFLGGERASPIAVALDAIAANEQSGADSLSATTFANGLLRSLTREQFAAAGDVNWLAGSVTRRMVPAVAALTALTERGWMPTLLPSYLLSTAMVNRDPALVGWFLDHRVTVTPEKDSLGQPVSLIESPLMLAVSMGDSALATRLLAAGATVHTAGRRNGLTPLGVALRDQNAGMADQLRRAGDSLDSISTPLLLGLALVRSDATLLAAVAARTDRPIRSVPAWSDLGRALMTDSTTLERALRVGLRPDAFLLRFSDLYDVPSADNGSLIELLLRDVVARMTGPQDGPRFDSLLTARINRLARAGVMPTLMARFAREETGGTENIPALTLSIGLRRATLALLSVPTARMSAASSSMLRGIATCQNDKQIVALATRRGARAMPVDQQRDLCARLASEAR
jgi:ankyrin repeat protein